MTRKLTLVLVALLAIGCDATDPCDEVVAKAIGSATANDTTTPDTVKRIKVIERRQCDRDQWSTEVLDCYAGERSNADVLGCRNRLRVDQADKLAAQQVRVTGGWERLLAELLELKAKICACADQPCALELGKKLKAWSDEQRGQLARRESTSGEVMAEIEGLRYEIGRCRARFGSTIDATVAKMDEFTNKMCICTDADCAQRVSDEMITWAQAESKERPYEGMWLSYDERTRLTAVTTKMTRCMTTALGVGTTPHK